MKIDICTVKWSLQAKTSVEERESVKSMSTLQNQARQQANLYVQGLVAQASIARMQLGSFQTQAGLQSACSAQA